MPQGSDLVFNRLNAHYKKTGEIITFPQLAYELRGRVNVSDVVAGIQRFDKHLDAIHALEAK